jgi:coenzyme F420-0:L-glutamate ligase / coenzyme F420-1:gamma-L-glutamate ligase
LCAAAGCGNAGSGRALTALTVWPLPRLPEIRPGDDLAGMMAAQARAGGVVPGDIVCVAHKVVSKAEGRVVEIETVPAGPEARQLADETGKSASLCQLILDESARIVRRRGSLLVCETHHGFICANAGIDQSNVEVGWAVLLPRDPDASARRLQARIAEAVGGRVGVVITDTHGRAFRRGLINLAIGVAGFMPHLDHRGGRDREGRMLVATDQGLADELAAVAGMFMGKDAGTAVVACSGVTTAPSPGGVAHLLRAADQDLFRG